MKHNLRFWSVWCFITGASLMSFDYGDPFLQWGRLAGIVVSVLTLHLGAICWNKADES